jgi:hypothetical protein
LYHNYGNKVIFSRIISGTVDQSHQVNSSELLLKSNVIN